MQPRNRIVALAASALLLATLARAARGREHWVASWGASPMAAPASGAGEFTVREFVHLSLGGAQWRLRLSNGFGRAPLSIVAARLARPRSLASGAVAPASERAVTFGGRATATIPAGAAYCSDPVALALPAGADLAVTLVVAAPPATATEHAGAHQTTFVAAGNQAGAAVLRGARTVEHWYFLAAVDVLAPPAARAIVCLGDSITDGHASTLNGNDRWPDDLAARLRRGALQRGVVNEGIGGNRLLLDGIGPNALARFDRDVVAQAGAGYVIVLEGINDLGMLTRDHTASAAVHRALVRRILAAYRQIVLRAHAHGLRVMGATITPDGGPSYYHPDAASEADRQAINAWIRAPGHFDAVADFDRALRDPAHPDRLRPADDSGDHLHPSPAGYRALAAAVPLTFFQRPRAGK